MATAKTLINFHLDCAEEYVHTIQHYNILFYGYGNKRLILEEIFPKAIHYNCYMKTTKEMFIDILALLMRDRGLKTIEKIYKLDFLSAIEKIDKYYNELKKTIIFVFYNYNRSLNILTDFKSFSLICTIEKIDFNITYKDIQNCNFILRDLTTFEEYDEELSFIKLQINNTKFETTIKVIKSVSNKVKNIFKEVLKNLNGKTIFEKDLLQKVGKRFLIKSHNEVINSLNEFYDHKVLKNMGSSHQILLSTKEIEEILKDWDSLSLQ